MNTRLAGNVNMANCQCASLTECTVQYFTMISASNARVDSIHYLTVNI